MAFRVLLTGDAVREQEEIGDYVDAHESRARADDVLDRIEEAFQALSEHPHRGRYPGELLDIGIREYREVFFKPYRVFYTSRPPNLPLASARGLSIT